MNELPWVPLYFGDHLRDTVGFSEAARVTYFQLVLCYQNIVPIPADPAVLAEKLGLKCATVEKGLPELHRLLKLTPQGYVWPNWDRFLEQQREKAKLRRAKAIKATAAREQRKNQGLSVHETEQGNGSSPVDILARPRTRARTRTSGDDLGDEPEDRPRDEPVWGNSAWSDMER